MIAEKLYTCHLSLNNGDAESLKEEKKDSKSDNLGDNDQIVGEVMWIKEVILSNNQLHESDSYSILYESLMTLQKMQLYVDVLKTTKIGRTVCVMRKHSSSKIRKLARCLIDSWRVLVDEYVNFAATITNKTTSNFRLGCSSKQTSEQKSTSHSSVGVKGKQSEEVSDLSKLEQEDNHDREVTPDLPSPGHDLQRDEEDKSVPSGGDINAKQNEQLTTEAYIAEHKHRDYESNDPQYVPRRLHQNQRGGGGRHEGGRSQRGHSNSSNARGHQRVIIICGHRMHPEINNKTPRHSSARYMLGTVLCTLYMLDILSGCNNFSQGWGGNGGYDNGRNQYYDHYYHPRNYYNPRLGRGGRGGGSAMYNYHGASGHGSTHGHGPSNVELGASA